jgi:hypothetical protein
MKWVESLGGPLILLPTEKMVNWFGDAGPRNSQVSHYGLACSVKDYCGTIQIGGAQAFVVADEPLPTTWVKTGKGGQLVRWIAAETEAELLETAGTIKKDEYLDSVIEYESTVGPHSLFDSVYSGSEAKESITIEIQSNRTKIATYFAKTGNVWLVVHDFEEC